MLGIAVLIAFVLALSLGVWIARWLLTPAELRGDWWPRFEREFRAYASRVDQRHTPRERGDDRRSIGQ